MASDIGETNPAQAREYAEAKAAYQKLVPMGTAAFLKELIPVGSPERRCGIRNHTAVQTVLYRPYLLGSRVQAHTSMASAASMHAERNESPHLKCAWIMYALARRICNTDCCMRAMNRQALLSTALEDAFSEEGGKNKQGHRKDALRPGKLLTLMSGMQRELLAQDDGQHAQTLRQLESIRLKLMQLLESIAYP